MTDQATGYSTSSPQEGVEALQGRVQALEIALIQMMRIITQGKTGEDAYQTLATGLRADARNVEAIPTLTMKAAHTELLFLAGVFGQPPEPN